MDRREGLSRNYFQNRRRKLPVTVKYLPCSKVCDPFDFKDF
ncbi:hypothetical protein HMPREF9104_02365 [Lentilactobacillus kisonensis F0435]|uniref:Uncharacterized protein n=1 Tax=Lentilactobacillus kisonensis F0435 TaxID=797516 RepID=H1LIC4_9LACO|nr:hypothetical protein HMPREF9104_02365 [Lentilactobacillus kisonensis F0435]